MAVDPHGLMTASGLSTRGRAPIVRMRSSILKSSGAANVQTVLILEVYLP